MFFCLINNFDEIGIIFIFLKLAEIILEQYVKFILNLNMKSIGKITVGHIKSE